MRAFFTFLFLFAVSTHAQVGAPLQVEGDTLSLWTFDTNSDDSVLDQAPDPLNGTIFGATRIELPEIAPEYGVGVKVDLDNQFVDFGTTRGSKLDLKDAGAFSVEAIVRQVGSADENHIIFSNDQVQLMLVGNKLGGFIRTVSGFRGLILETNFPLNVNTRVGLYKSGTTLALGINGVVQNSVTLEEPIVDTSYADARVSIGGNIFGQFFPGYIDDVRISSTPKIDLEKPLVTKIMPNSYTLSNPRPEFEFTLEDAGTGVDVSSVEVFLNGVKQTGLNITVASITGPLDSDLDPTRVNDVTIIVSDIVGNTARETFNFAFSSIGAAEEYETDENTLGLWHMNDFARAIMEDSSGNGKHGYADPEYSNVGNGVFSKGRYFEGTSTSYASFGTIQLEGREFTIEGWLNPTSNNSYEQEIFNSGQIKIARFSEGRVRVVFYETRKNEVFETIEPILPVGEKHHLAVTWDGEKKENSLTIFIDGSPVKNFNACISCDMNPVPETGTVGKYFAGMMDELRFSNIVRKSFNVPNNDSRTIEFLALNNASSTAKSFPQVQIALNSDSGVDPSKIKVFLNGSEQVADENLTITANTIEGQLNEPIKLGVNYLSVEFVDNGNVQKKKTTYFFGVEHKPLSYLSTDPNTKGLYHFERFNKFTDSSGNNNHLTGTENEVEGVLGKGQAGAANLPVFQMGSRSFTLEAYVKGNSSYSSMMQLFKLQGTEFNFRFSVNPETGEIYYYLNTPDMNLSKTVQGAFPTDKEFHHVSAVYDASRAHAQLLIFVDGKIVQANDINRSCDFSGDISFSVGTTYLDVDEARIKNDADYSYSLKDSVSSPSITLVGLSEEETITTPTREIEIQLNSSVGINNLGNKVLLNSQEVQGLNFSQTGQTATLTGNLSGYVGGANILEVISRDVDGRENIDSMLFYYFASSNTGEYNSDEDTYVLLHFNETSGNYVSDVSQYGHDFSFSSGWTLDTEGMFGTSGASTYSTSLNSTLSDLTGVGAYTIEMWKKDTSGTSAELFKLGSLQLRKSSGKLYFYAPSGGPAISTTESFSYDGQFHHYAVVVDLEHEFRNVYLLRDGVVVKSEKLSDLEGHRLSNATDARMGSYFYGDSVDEFRFSTRARYILNSAKN